jgi:hypothetical protein
MRVRRRVIVLRAPLREPDLAEVLRALLDVEVRRPARRLLEFAPMPIFCPRAEEFVRLRLADFMRLVAIATILSAFGRAGSPAQQSERCGR